MGKIKIVEGNLIDAYLEGSVDVMMHICNTQGRMGSGIAKEVRERIPKAYENYIYEHAHVELQLGEYTSDGLGCFNLNAQKNYGYDNKMYINYAALGHCLHDIYNHIFFHYADHGKDIKIGIPYLMGAGLAGGDFSIVSEIVEYWLGDHELIAYKLI